MNADLPEPRPGSTSMAVSRILIVDDNKMFRSALRKELELHADWQVSEAVDGADGVKETRFVVPHLIIMDLSMPYMTGIQAACEILKERPKIPIVLLTSHFTDQLVEEGRRHGIRATLSKDAMQHLVPTVESLLLGGDLTVPARTRG